jgi:hypothetical protein
MATDPNAFQLTPEQLAMLGQAAARTGKPPAEVLTEALRQYQSPVESAAGNGAQQISLYDRLARKDLIGCLSGGPADLSTNPKYMEGFGESDR